MYVFLLIRENGIIHLDEVCSIFTAGKKKAEDTHFLPQIESVLTLCVYN